MPGVRRTASVVAFSFCEAHRISRANFEHVLADFPELHARIRTLASERMRALAEQAVLQPSRASAVDESADGASLEPATAPAPSVDPGSHGTGDDADSHQLPRAALRGAICANWFLAGLSHSCRQSRHNSGELTTSTQGHSTHRASAFSHSVAQVANANARKMSDPRVKAAQQSIEAIAARLAPQRAVSGSSEAAPRRRRISREWARGLGLSKEAEDAAEDAELAAPRRRRISRERRVSKGDDDAADDAEGTAPRRRRVSRERRMSKDDDDDFHGSWISNPLRWKATAPSSRTRVVPEEQHMLEQPAAPVAPPQAEMATLMVPPPHLHETQDR